MSDKLFSSVEQKYDLPAGLLDAVWAKESGRGKYMTSPVGAQGHFQFMPATAKQYGLDDPADLTKSADAAGRMFRDLSSKYSGDVPKMLAAYNWGQGNVDKKGIENLPAETRDYVDTIAPKVQSNDIVSQIKAARAGGVSDDDIWNNLPFTVHASGLKKAKDSGLIDEQIAAGLGLKLTAKPAAQSAKVSETSEVPKEPRSGIGDFVGGLKKSVLDTAGGLNQMAAHAGKYIADLHPALKAFDESGQKIGIVPSAVAAENADSTINARRKEEAPMMDTWQGKTGNIVGSIAQMVGPGTLSKAGSVARNLLLTPKSVPQAAAGGALFGGVQAVGEGENRLTNAGLGAVGGSLGYGTAKAIGALGSTAKNMTPEIKDLALKARDKWGIEITAPQIADSRVLNTLRSVSKDVPFSGVNEQAIKQQKQFNTAIAKTMGESSDNLLTAIESAKSRLGSAFETTLKGNKVKIDDPFMEGMARVVKDAETELTDAQAGVLKKNIDNILAATDGNGAIDGQAAYNIKKMLDRLGKSQDTSLAHYGRELQGELMDALNRSIGPEQAATFKTVREQYKNMLTAAKVVSNDGYGNAPMGGARLVSEAKKYGAKDLEELGRIANQFLRDKTPDSGTARRVVAASMLGGGAVVNPMILGAIPAARVINSAMSSKFVTNRLLNGSAAADKAGKGVNVLLRPAAVDQLRAN